MNRYQKYNQTENGKKRRAEYRATNNKHVTTAKYLSKPFIAIGGLAITQPDGNLTYAHLALSTGQSITNPDGLTTNQIFSFILDNTPDSDQGILVSYTGAYDWNNWLKDLNLDQLKTIYGGNYRTSAIDNGIYSIKLNPGQSITLYDLWRKKRTINEIYNFYQVPLSESAKEYLNIQIPGGSKYEKAVTPDQLNQGKQNLLFELQTTANLMAEFRARLEKVNLRPRRWNGSGGIVTNLFAQHNIKDHLAEQPADIAKIARYAYAGGRFEIIQYGQQKQKQNYAYDINSAYPEAMTKLPSLKGGRWLHIDGDPGNHEYGLYKITIKGKKAHLPHPLFTRDYKGNISYPRTVTGWYWSPEIAAVRIWAEKGFGTYEIEQAYLFDPATDTKPFAWIANLYQQRLELQRQGDNAETGLKLALNTAYGKLAQQVGFIPADEKNAQIIPPYHQLEYAGYITSYTRAKIYLASIEQIHAVIAYETDAVFMQQELYNLPVGDQLGEYRETPYQELTYLNSGIYYGTKKDGTKVFKLRGITANSVTIQQIEKALELPEDSRKLEITQNRFISGSQIVNHNNLEAWLTWRKEIIDLKLYPNGKRVHYLCGCDSPKRKGLFIGGWHTTVPAKPYTKMYEYSVEWINPQYPQIETRRQSKINNEQLL